MSTRTTALILALIAPLFVMTPVFALAQITPPSKDVVIAIPSPSPVQTLEISIIPQCTDWEWFIDEDGRYILRCATPPPPDDVVTPQ